MITAILCLARIHYSINVSHSLLIFTEIINIVQITMLDHFSKETDAFNSQLQVSHGWVFVFGGVAHG